MEGERDTRVEMALGRLLTVATGIAGVVLLVGVVWQVARMPGAARTRYEVFEPAADGRYGLGALVQSVMKLEPHAVMLLGVLLLVLTPMARVVFTLVAFAVRRDWMYVVMTGVVLAVLAYGVFGSGA